MLGCPFVGFKGVVHEFILLSVSWTKSSRNRVDLVGHVYNVIIFVKENGHTAPFRGLRKHDLQLQSSSHVYKMTFL